MTHQNQRGRVTPDVIRPLKTVQLGGFERTQDNQNGARPQGGSPLNFHPASRLEAMRTAEALNEAAARMRRVALANAGCVGRSLDALAGHYATRAASYFMVADRLPEVAA